MEDLSFVPPTSMSMVSDEEEEEEELEEEWPGKTPESPDEEPGDDW